MDNKILSDKFMTFSQAFDGMKKERRSRDNEKICKYGVSLLDNELGGILENELVVIGAGTGIGKTELAVTIAMENAMRGKKVALFSLEGDVYEICYRYSQREVNRKRQRDNRPLVRGPEYRMNLSNVDYDEDIIGSSIDKRLDNLYIFKKEKIPNKTELLEILKDLHGSVDMIIIDHLHYLSLDGKTEREGLSDIIMAVKQTTEIMRIPIVMISHLSGEHSKSKRMPGVYDLHGSSDIGKNANTVILLQKDEDRIAEMTDKKLAPTRIIIAKNRSGVPTPTIIGATFDTMLKEYKKGEQYNSVHNLF